MGDPVWLVLLFICLLTCLNLLFWLFENFAIMAFGCARGCELSCILDYIGGCLYCILDAKIESNTSLVLLNVEVKFETSIMMRIEKPMF